MTSSLHLPDLDSGHTIGLVGFFGWGNYGDELMLEVWGSLLPWPAEPMHDQLTAPYFTTSAVEAVRPVDGIVIGGGDLVLARTVSPLYWNRAWLRRPCAVAGIGVALEQGDFRADIAPRLRDFLTHDRVISVSTRDVASADWLRDRAGVTGVRCTADLAFAAALPPRSPHSPRPPRPEENLPPLAPGDRVAVVIRKAMSEEIVEAVDRFLTWAADRGAEAEFLVAATRTEAAADRSAIRDRWPDLRIRQELSVEAVSAALADYRVVASAKFHITLMCARLGAPTVALRTTNKTQQLADQLQDPRAARVVRGQDDDRLLDELCAAPLRQTRLAALEQQAHDEVRRVIQGLSEAFDDRDPRAAR